MKSSEAECRKLEQALRDLAQDRDEQHELAEARKLALVELEEENTALRHQLAQRDLTIAQYATRCSYVAEHLEFLARDLNAGPAVKDVITPSPQTIQEKTDVG